MTYDDDTIAFLEEREKKIGGKLIYRTFSTWFAEIGGERREWGVFMYSDGKTLAFEDFFHKTRILGYDISSKSEKEREKNYVKMEYFIPLSDIDECTYVSRPSAEKSLKTIKDVSKESTLFNKIFTKNCTRLKVGDRVFFFELPSYREFRNMIEQHKEIR